MRSLKETLIKKHATPTSHIREIALDFKNLESGILVRVTEVYHGSLYWLGINKDLCKKFFPMYAHEFDDEKGAITHFDSETKGNLSFIRFSSYEKRFPFNDMSKFIINKTWKLDQSTLSELKDKDPIIEFLKLSYEDPEGFEKSLGL